MSAKNGSAVTLHKRSLVAVCVAAAFVLCAVFSSAASAKVPIKETYLALGDSLAFGYSHELENNNANAGDPATAFEHGYVNEYFLKMKPKAVGMQLQNLACPGETTESMAGPALEGLMETYLGFDGAGVEGPEGAIKEGVGNVEYEETNIKGAKAVHDDSETPCAYHKAQVEEAAYNKELPNGWSAPGFTVPLHNEYSEFTGKEGSSQLEAALGAIAEDAAAGKPVTTLTINIGSNDQLHFIKECEVEGEEGPGGTALYTTLAEHGYTGENVDPGGTPPGIVEAAEYEAATGGPAGEKALGEAIAAATLAVEEYVTGEPEELTGKPPYGCLKTRLGRSHTSPYGYKFGVLERIAKNIGAITALLRNAGTFGVGIDYTGKIDYVGVFNPYGNVVKRATTREELKGINYEVLKGSNPLAYVSNFNFGEAAKAGAAGGEFCLAETLTKFNPQTGQEPGHLQKWTEMTNTSTSPVEIEGKTYNVPNGPDVHATPLGYIQMATVLYNTCGA